MQERLRFERELEALYESPQPVSSGGAMVADFGKVEEAVQNAAKRNPDLEPFLKEASYRVIILADRAAIRGAGDNKTYVYPVKPMNMKQGFYLYKLDAQNKQQMIFDLSSGQRLKSDPVLVHIIAGDREIASRQKNATGIFWATQTLVAPPSSPSMDPDALEFPLQNFPALIRPQEVDEFLKQNPPIPLIIPGLTGGTFHPNRYQEKPLKFTYYTHDGSSALVSRQHLGEEFYYRVGIGHIQNYLRSYPFAYAGRAAMGMAIYAQLVVEIGISFIPIIGPLYSLFQTGKGVYDAYKNWDKMSGWEKALVGVDVLLTGLPGGFKGIKAIKGGFQMKEGVSSLVKAGLPKREATTLMLSAAVLQQEKATMRVVEKLGETIKKGGRLTLEETIQVERMFQSMLKRLPATDKALMTAQYAIHDVQKARQLFNGIELTEQHVKGLQRLSPEVIVELQKVAGQERTVVVQRIAMAAEKSPQVALGINHLQSATRPSHLIDVVNSLGDGALEELGRHSIGISDDLASLVKKASGAETAYKVLMQGGKLKDKRVPGLAHLLAGAQAPKLKPGLLDIQRKFSRTFLTEIELYGISKLGKPMQEILDKASDAQLRKLANMAGESADAGNALNRLATDLLTTRISHAELAGILDRFDIGLLKLVERNGIQVSKELLDQVASMKGKTRFGRVDTAKAMKVLLEGFSAKGKSTVGVLDQLAEKIPSTAKLKEALDLMDSLEHQANLFSRWAMRNENAIQGIAALKKLRPTDAQAKIKGIYRNFGYQTGLSVLEECGKLEKQSHSPTGLDHLIADLASSGADKAKGASLTLDFAVHTYPTKVLGFEGGMVGNIKRQYDLIAENIYHEMKYWSDLDGKKLAQAAGEFERDIMLHLESNFRNLKWVFSKNMESYKSLIRDWMEDLLEHSPEVKKFLAAKKIDPAEARRRLQTALAPSGGWLLRFY